MHPFARPRLRGIWLPLAAVVACGGGPAPASTSAPAPAEPRIARVADANTAALLLTLHTVDLAAARIATTRAQRREVKLLARRMTTDHTSLSSTLTKLLATLDLKPREDEVSRLLRGQNVARRDTLRSVAVRRFDSTYVANEVRFHQDLLVAIDRVFLPSVGHPELRDYVTAMRPTIAEHLAHAEQVQTSLATRK